MRTKRKTHVFDSFHIVNIPALVVLTTGARARPGEQSGLIVIFGTDIIAIKEGRCMAPVGGAHATAASTLHAIALSHLCLCRASRRRGHGFKDFLVI
jgi:hypothetical protein